ncbi:g_PROTEIN_RECEP_F2_3 domain-containing protein [Caerostris extrusa]|uniref:G_PROTEIN_RECEP_F2_3 domain-containing protein n=1 Tax=Caerostris extrusa TaxID=172846 RepID=A0AAV4YGS2_CAEEX|nr:g_PROTEIN_RECEP_F2_3 domain-containing protein [Caerostris extrusa]
MTQCTKFCLNNAKDDDEDDAKDGICQAQRTLHCPRTWDGWQCWPDTPAGEEAEGLCQEHVYFMSQPPPCPKIITPQMGIVLGSTRNNQQMRNSSLEL